MATMERPKTMSDLPAQHASSPATKAEERARFFNSGNAFNIKLFNFASVLLEELHEATTSGTRNFKFRTHVF